MAHWLGSDAEPDLIGTIIGSGGIPAVLHNGTSLTIDRVWVVATINGTDVALYPAFKPNEKQTGIDLATGMGYDKTALLSATGGTLGTDSIQNLNTIGLSTELSDLTSQLVNQLRQNYPNAYTRGIVGGVRIVPDQSANLPTALPFVGNPTEAVWTDIPAGYIHTVRLQHGVIDTTLDIPQIAGKKHSISYTGGTDIDPPPAGATDFGSTSPGTDSTTTHGWTLGNPNSVTIQITNSISGTDASAFQFLSGGSVNNVAAGGNVQVQIKFTGVNQTPGRKNATLTIAYSYQGNVFNTQTVLLTGAVECTPSGNLTDLKLTVDHPYTASVSNPCFTGAKFGDQWYAVNRTTSPSCCGYDLIVQAER